MSDFPTIDTQATSKDQPKIGGVANIGAYDLMKMNDYYYLKYIKYKQKYLKLKEKMKAMKK